MRLCEPSVPQYPAHGPQLEVRTLSDHGLRQFRGRYTVKSWNQPGSQAVRNLMTTGSAVVVRDLRVGWYTSLVR